MIRREMPQYDDVAGSTLTGYDVSFANFAILGCPFGLARNPHGHNNPSFTTFYDQVLEERKKINGHLSYPFLSKE